MQASSRGALVEPLRSHEVVIPAQAVALPGTLVVGYALRSVLPGATPLFEEPLALQEVAKPATVWFEKHLPRGERP